MNARLEGVDGPTSRIGDSNKGCSLISSSRAFVLLFLSDASYKWRQWSLKRMAGNWEFALVLIDLVVLLTAKESEENLFSKWCDAHPHLGGLLRGGRHHRCYRSSPSRFDAVRTKTLKGVTLRVGVLEGDEERSYDCGVRYDRRKWLDVDSYSSYILKLLQEVLEFDVSYVPASNCSQVPNSKVTTLLNFMKNNETDLCVCHWAMSEEALETADFLFPTLKTTEAFVFAPENLPLTQDVFLGTFSYKLWIFFVVSIFLLVISFKFSTSMHSRVRPDHEPWTWDEVVLWAVATVSQQSYSRHPRGSSCRTMFFIGYTISYLLYTGFAAGITSLLALSGHRCQLTFDDISSMKLKLLFYRDEYYFDYPGKAFTSISMEGYTKDREFDNLPGIFSKIARKKAVGYGTTVSFVNHLKRLDVHRRSTYLVVPLPIFTRQKSFLVRKSFPYKDLFNYWLLRFDEKGLLHLGDQRYLKNREQPFHSKNLWLSADLKNVFSAFVFLLGGWTLSLLVLGLEKLRWRRTRRGKL